MSLFHEEKHVEIIPEPQEAIIESISRCGGKFVSNSKI